MKRLLGSLALLCLCLSPATPARAQGLTLDQLFWLRSKSEGDDSEWLVDHNWRFGKSAIVKDSLYYSASWFYQDAHQKLLAKLAYESRGAGNVTTITYSTSSKLTFTKIQAKLAAYQLRYAGQKKEKGIVWSYYKNTDFDVKLAISSTSKAASAPWYTVVVRPRWR